MPRRIKNKNANIYMTSSTLSIVSCENLIRSYIVGHTAREAGRTNNVSPKSACRFFSLLTDRLYEELIFSVLEAQLNIIFKHREIEKRRNEFIVSGIKKTRCHDTMSFIFNKYRFNWIFNMFMIHEVTPKNCKVHLSVEKNVEIILSDIRAVVKYTGPLNSKNKKIKKHFSCFCGDGCIDEIPTYEMYGNRIGRRLANKLRLNPDKRQPSGYIPEPISVISDAILKSSSDRSLLDIQAFYPID